ncbi:hypothetical protein [Paenibacillus sp. 79R4]|nr:hypothetical protein [Paenibacillus sp. 79R4]
MLDENQGKKFDLFAYHSQGEIVHTEMIDEGMESPSETVRLKD